MDAETRDFLETLEEAPEHDTSNDDITPSGQRECPICKAVMQVETEHGVRVDVCPAHGLWLDRGELRAMASRIRAGERLNKRTAVNKARRDGKLSGVIFGIWALLLD